MSWREVLVKNQQNLPSSDIDLLLILNDDNKIQDLLETIENAEVLGSAGKKYINSLQQKSEFSKRILFRNNTEALWEKFLPILEAVKAKTGSMEQTTSEKLVSSVKEPEKYKKFIESLRENPLSKKVIGRLSPTARIAYQKLMENTENFSLTFNFDTGIANERGITKKNFEDSMDLLANVEGISKVGNTLVFDTDNMNEAMKLIQPNPIKTTIDKKTKVATRQGVTRERQAFDDYLRMFIDRAKIGSQTVELPTSMGRFSENLKENLLTGKKYTVKPNLEKADYYTYIKAINDANVPIKMYEPLVRGAGMGVAGEIFLSSPNNMTLSPYGLLLLETDFNQDWFRQFFKGVKTSKVFSNQNMMQRVVGDIISALKEGKDRLYGDLSLSAFDDIDTALPRDKFRSAVLSRIKSSETLNSNVKSKATGFQTEIVGQMEKDDTLLLPKEAEILQDQLGDRAIQVEYLNYNLERTPKNSESTMFARVIDTNGGQERLLSRKDIESLKDLDAKDVSALLQISEFLKDPTKTGDDFATLLMELVEDGTYDSIGGNIGRRNNLDAVTTKNALIFLIEMSDQFDERLDEVLENYKEALEDDDDTKAEKAVEAIYVLEGEMPSLLKKYKEGMLEALKYKLDDIAENYEKYIKGSARNLESVIQKLLRAELILEPVQEE